MSSPGAPVGIGEPWFMVAAAVAVASAVPVGNGPVAPGVGDLYSHAAGGGGAQAITAAAATPAALTAEPRRNRRRDRAARSAASL